MSDTGMYDAIVDDSNDPDEDTGIIINDDLTVVRRGYCRRCTYINNDANVVCQACDLALVANPFATVDAVLVNQIRHNKIEEQTPWNDVQKQDDILGENTIHQQPINDQILPVLTASRVSIINPIQWCLIAGCGQPATLCRPFCFKHNARRFCEHKRCTAFVRGCYQSCFAHGGRRCCSHLGCDKIAHDYFAEHCDGKRCRGQYKFDALDSSQCKPGIVSDTIHQKPLSNQEQHTMYQESIIELAHCNFSGCNESARSRRPFCLQHSGNRFCKRPGDDTCAPKAPTQSSATHDVGIRCKWSGRENVVHGKCHCAAHGPGRQCNALGCEGFALLGSYRCKSHCDSQHFMHESKSQERLTSQEHHTRSLKSIDEQTQCRTIGCNESAISRRPYCHHHGGKRTCFTDIRTVTEYKNLEPLTSQDHHTLFRKPINEQTQCRIIGVSQDHHTLFRKPINEQTQCRIIGCNEAAISCRLYCLYHSGNRLCEHDGCNKCAQGSTRYCIAHGGGRRCTVPGCEKGARSKLFCKMHCGGKCCSTEGCKEFVVGGSSQCKSHGDRERFRDIRDVCKSKSQKPFSSQEHHKMINEQTQCRIIGCSEAAISCRLYCLYHRLYEYDKCKNCAHGLTRYCIGHGRGRRCTIPGCKRVARRKMFCRMHAAPVAVAVADGDTTGGGDDDLTTDAYSTIDYIDEGTTRIHRTTIDHSQVIVLSSMAHRDDDDIPRNIVVVTDGGIVVPSTSTSRNNVTTEASDKDDESINSFGTGTSQTTVSSSVIQKFERLKTTVVNGKQKNSDNFEATATVAEITKKPAATTYIDLNKDHQHGNGNDWTMVERQQQQHHSTRVRKSNWDDDSVLKWNTSSNNLGGSYHCGSYNSTGIADSSSVANGSTISGFDIISLNGASSQLACGRCTFLNRSLDVFCTVCGIALLGPNPCMDVDAILAQQLQENENQLAYEITQWGEMKRRQSSVDEFTKNIFHFFDELGCDNVGYSLLPEHSMMILASRFIESMIALYRNGKAADVLIRCCVLYNLDGMLYENIKEHGFPANLKFCTWSTLDVHNHHCDPLMRNTITKKQRTSCTICSTATAKPTTIMGVIIKDDEGVKSRTALGIKPKDEVVKLTTTLSVIPEDVNVVRPIASSSPNQIDDSLGWIAAILKSDTTIDVWSENDTKCVTHVPNPCQTLPLISFDAALAKDEVTKRIFNSLIRVCNDYFDVMQESIDGDITLDTGYRI